MSKKRAARRSYAEWDRLVDEWSASGESQEKFAEAHGINPRTFQGWVWRSRKRRGLTSKDKTIPCQFVELSSPPEVETPRRGQCRITMSNTQIEFSSSSDAEWIAEILSRLGQLR
jgi:transposase-like protein